MKYTRQTAFTRAVRRLLKQGRRATQDLGCVLMDNAGNRCAIGHLLSAKNARASLNLGGSDAAYAITGDPEIGPLACLLREIHDEVTPRAWCGKFKALAEREGLKMPKEWA